jgi:predicted O-methyltransferase YrrM
MVTDIYEKLVIPEEHRVVALQKEEGEFLYNFVKEKNVRSSLETGFAYGCSTAHLVAGTQAPHVVIDPYQEVSFDNLGLKNIERLGLSQHVRLLSELSCFALPKLVLEGLTVDLAFIDAGHKFDDIFIDWYYCDLLLRPHGHILFHDIWMESTKRVASFIRNNRADYMEVNTRMGNLFAFRKISEDTRAWDHYEPF